VGRGDTYQKYIDTGGAYRTGSTAGPNNRSKILTEPQTGKKEATSQHRHSGQQTLRDEVTQAWGAVNESQQHLACATHSLSTPFTVACNETVGRNTSSDASSGLTPGGQQTLRDEATQAWGPGPNNQSKILTEPHTGKGEATSQHSHSGQQPLRHEATQAWWAVKSASAQPASQSKTNPHQVTHGQGEATSQHRHSGQQTLRHEATQAWGDGTARPPAAQNDGRGSFLVESSFLVDYGAPAGLVAEEERVELFADAGA